MTKKLARRWLNQNKWNIAKWNLGFLKEGITQFSRQYFICKRAQFRRQDFTCKKAIYGRSLFNSVGV